MYDEASHDPDDQGLSVGQFVDYLHASGFTRKHDAAPHPPPEGANSESMPPVSRVWLSDRQRQFLLWLLPRWEWRKEQQRAGRFVGGWGVPLIHLPFGVSRSESAVRSRALRSLERRGYIRRRNDMSGDTWSGEPSLGRTTCVELTEAGRKLAEALRAEAYS